MHWLNWKQWQNSLLEFLRPNEVLKTLHVWGLTLLLLQVVQAERRWFYWRHVHQGSCSSTYLDASTCCDDISFHSRKWRKRLFFRFTDRKHPQRLRRGKRLYEVPGQKEKIGVMGLTVINRRVWINCGSFISRVFRTYLLLDRVSGQAQGWQSAGDPRVALS